MIKIKQKLIFLVLCLCFGVAFGKTDSSFVLMMSGFGNLFNYVVFYQLGFAELFHFYPPVNLFSTIKLLSNSFVWENNISFLVLPTLLFLLSSLLINIRTTKKEKLLLFFAGALLISAMWDASYCFFVDGFLSFWEKGAKVQWLPLQNPLSILSNFLVFGVVPNQLGLVRDLLNVFLIYQVIEGTDVGISFYWHFGYVFIVARFVVALVLLFWRRRKALKR